MVKAGKSRTISVAAGTVRWRVTTHEGRDLWRSDLGGGSVRIDPACSHVGREPDRLPNTGGPSAWILAGLIGVVGGSALLRRRG